MTWPDHDVGRQLRHIKWILIGVLACLIAITVALIPDFGRLLLRTVNVAATAALLIGIAYIAWIVCRGPAKSLWFEIWSMWRR